tara:strand:- start:582 stop:764 length:183 start_codon:yes stop_codon:yes gene_type:complete
MNSSIKTNKVPMGQKIAFGFGMLANQNVSSHSGNIYDRFGGGPWVFWMDVVFGVSFSKNF